MARSPLFVTIVTKLQVHMSESIPRHPVLVASNRGPVSFGIGDDGSLTARRGGGGMVLRPVLCPRRHATGGAHQAPSAYSTGGTAGLRRA